MDTIKNINKLYAIRFFYNLIPAYVIERLFWEERGMSIQMVVYTEIIYAITIVFLEVPTGIIADKWGRKNLIIASAFLGCMEFLILVYATEFWHFAVVVILAGIGTSATSGAGNALLYDTLLMSKKEYAFEKHLGRLNVFDFSAGILAALSGSLLANRFGFELNYWLSFSGMMVSLLISLLLVEPVIKSGTEETVKVSQYLKASLDLFRNHHGIGLVVLVGMVTGAAMNFIDEFWQLYLERLTIPVVYFGVFSSVLFLLRLPGNLLAYKLKNRFSYRMLLSGVLLVFAAGFICMSFIKGYAGITAILLVCLFSGIVEPITTGYLHHQIDSTMRATIDSFQSLGYNVVLIFTSLGFGYFSNHFDLFGGYGFIGILCTLFLVSFWTVSKARMN
ncbi:MFS transporter [Pseudalkalibacillus sp. R45]|uniref:MFS transporter n=1 Tax=Pseudalkalibacillus sp. R45 TaxID=3457433 RepID=UPI003FCEB112